MDVCQLWVLCVVRWRSPRRADHSSRGVLPTVVCRCVWSRNLVNEEALAHWGAVTPKPTNPYPPHYFLFMLHDYFIAVIRRFGITNCKQILTGPPWHKHQADSTGTFPLNEDGRIDGGVFGQWKIKFRTVKYLLTDRYFKHFWKF
jgi:hypothetical protein